MGARTFGVQVWCLCLANCLINEIGCVRSVIFCSLCLRFKQCVKMIMVLHCMHSYIIPYILSKWTTQNGWRPREREKRVPYSDETSSSVVFDDQEWESAGKRTISTNQGPGLPSPCSLLFFLCLSRTRSGSLVVSVRVILEFPSVVRRQASLFSSLTVSCLFLSSFFLSFLPHLYLRSSFFLCLAWSVLVQPGNIPLCLDLYSWTGLS